MIEKHIFIVVLVVSTLISGCVGTLEKEVSIYESHIQDSAQKASLLEIEIKRIENEIANTYINITEIENEKLKAENILRELSRSNVSSERWLSSNKDVYVNGYCITPDHGEKPEPYCPTRESSMKHALAYCSLSIGCDAIMLAFENELDSFSKRFLASEACSMSVSALQQKGYRADQTVLNAIEALSETGCKNNGEGFWAGVAAIGGCAVSALIKIDKINSFNNCVSENQNICYSIYTSWHDEPGLRKSKCLSSVDSITEYKNKAPLYNRKISKFSNTVTELSNDVNRLNTGLAKIRSLLSEQNERNTRYSKLLQKKKKTLAYKLIAK